MSQIIVVIVIALLVGFALRSVKRTAQPNFMLRPALAYDNLLFAVSILAGKNKKYEKGGDGLPYEVIVKKIDDAYKLIAAKIKEGADCTAYEKDIFDNHYKLTETVLEARRHAKDIAALPHCDGLPRIYLLCELLVKSCDGAPTRELIKEAVQTYNLSAPLLYDEVRLFPFVMSYALSEFAAVLCAKCLVISGMTARAVRDAAAGKPDAKRMTYNSYACAYAEHIDVSAVSAFEQYCLINGSDLQSRQASHAYNRQRYDMLMRAVMSSVFSKDAVFTDRFVLSLSPIYEQIMNEPDAGFDCLTPDTQAYYLSLISRIATKKKISETAVARDVLFRAKKEGNDISEYLLPKPRGKTFMRIFIALSVLPAILACIFVSLIFGKFAWAVAAISAPVFIAFFGILYAEIAKHAVTARRLPAYDVKKADKEKSRTLITVPRLIADSSEADAAFDDLAAVLCANPQEFFSYNLLLDLPPSDSIEDAEKDNAILERITQRYESFRHSQRVSVIVRRRKKGLSGDKYQGWEKKRGAVIELNRHIVSGGNADFRLLLGEVGEPQFVITLDSDTRIGDCSRLVEYMLHPYNRRYNVMTVNMLSEPENNATIFSRLFGGARGLNSYHPYLFGIENDLFAKGNFIGKGIYRVKEFYAATGDAFLENRILSHDYIEGAYAGTANTDVYAFDAFPDTFGRFFVREMRWLRGDWQFLPFLFGRVKNAEGQKVKNPLSPIEKFHIFMNTVYSLAPVSAVALLLLALVAQPVWVAVVIAFSLPALRLLLAVRSIFVCPLELCKEFLRQLFYVCLLPVSAFYRTYFILLTLWRLTVKKKLLDWKVFAHADGSVSLLPCPIAAIIFVATAAVFRLSPLFYVLSALFVAGVPFVKIAHLRRKAEPPDNQFCAELLPIAQKTYKFFCDMHTPQNNYLPCDNYQADGGAGYVRRTSPTDIGMMLIAFCAAYELKLCDKDELCERVQNTLNTLDLCEKWRGHIFNWIDTDNLQPLCRYVSTVDSGNLLAALVLLTSYKDCEFCEAAQSLIDGVDFTALTDEQRGLFYTGYNAQTAVYDTSHYDLLGSEAALTYLMAIGCGKADRSLYCNLSRRAVRYAGDTVYSWTGGMFEYLMPTILLDYKRGTLMDKACRGAVRAQLRYAQIQKLPVFGVSESQYNQKEDNGLYCYRAFGVDGVALSPAPDMRTTAPYAAFLAIKYAPYDVWDALDFYREQSADREMGLAEAYDCTSETVIGTFMAHHQGMLLSAAANYMTNGSLIERMRTLPEVRAAELLTYEAADMRGRRKVKTTEKAFRAGGSEIKSSGDTNIPYVNLLGGGALKSVTDSRGGGYLMFDGELATRFEISGEGVRIECHTDTDKFTLTDGEFTATDESTVYAGAHGEYSGESKVFILERHNAQVNSVRLSYTGAVPVEVTLCGIAELALDAKAASNAHPVFSKMFIDSGVDRDIGFVWAKRKGKGVYAAQFAANAHYCNNRAEFYGKGGNGAPDPILSSFVNVRLSPQSYADINFVTLFARDFESLKKTVRLLKTPGVIGRERTALTLPRRAKLLAAKLLYGSFGSVRLAAPGAPVPKVLIRIESAANAERLTELLRDLRIVAQFGIAYEIIVAYKERKGYYLHLTDKINRLIDKSGLRAMGVAVRAENLSDSPLGAEILQNCTVSAESFEFEPIEALSTAQITAAPAQTHSYDETRRLGIGGYTDDGGYGIDLTAQDTPAPWSNVIAYEHFGSVITAAGGGYTFAGNSQQNKLSKWSNDPVTDEVSEAVILGENGAVWSISKNPCRVNGAQYLCKHTPGCTEFFTNANGVRAFRRDYICPESESKFFDLSLISETDRELDVMVAVRPVLGDTAGNTAVATVIEKHSQYSLRLRNSVSGLTAYLTSELPIDSYCAHEEAFMRRGKVLKAGGLKDCGCMPYAAISVKVRLTAGQQRRVLFALGTAQPDFSAADHALQYASKYFGNLGHVKVTGFECDDRVRDSMHAVSEMLHWLPYQTLSCRFFARAAFYQAGGAFGFRDQLQDCLAVIYSDPKIVRAHLVRCAAHQFESGDVQHWWHEGGAGVRTRICDDRLFLPYAVCEYLSYTHDFTLLAERVPYLSDRGMNPTESSAYFVPVPTQHRADMLEHCLRAIDVTCDFGENGLVLMRGGDWNDGMDKVGERGYGTSVWCSMFLYDCINRMLPHINDKSVRTKYHAVCVRLEAAVARCFEDDRFVRAYTDDGVVLGSESSVACKIDLLTQSWAQLSKIADEHKCAAALNTALNRLVDPQHKTVKLLDPPFERDDAGYIGRYPAGIRENGGQYTHAAVWFLISLFDREQKEEAFRILEMLLPQNHCLTKVECGVYAVEPYVLSADVYSGERAGRGGWSWYTGAAGWMYKCLCERLLGIRISGETVRFAPQLPQKIKSVSLKLRVSKMWLNVKIVGSDRDCEWRLKIGEVTYNTDTLRVSPSLAGKQITVYKPEK